LRKFCADSGWPIVAEFVDHATGKRSDRDPFQAMFAAASRRKFDCLVTWALDRLSREGVAQTLDHIKTLRGYGVEYVSFSDPHFRTIGPAGELISPWRPGSLNRSTGASASASGQAWKKPASRGASVGRGVALSNFGESGFWEKGVLSMRHLPKGLAWAFAGLIYIRR
jgi:hypothetical protein